MKILRCPTCGNTQVGCEQDAVIVYDVKPDDGDPDGITTTELAVVASKIWRLFCLTCSYESEGEGFSTPFLSEA